MKIVLVHNAYQQPGGEDVVFEQERQLLERNGHEVITYCRSNEEIPKLTALQHIALVKHSIWARDTERDFTHLLACEKPDLVHVHNTFLMISPSVYGACQAKGVPVVQTLHNFRMTCISATLFREGKVCEECIDRGLWRGVYHGCYRDSRLVSASVALMLSLHRRWRTWEKTITCYIALTEFSRNKFIAAGLPADKIFAKPNFVESDPGKRGETGEYAVCVGRLSAEKGVATLLRAWKMLPRQLPLQIVGDGPERKSLEALARQLELSSVTFRGRLPREETFGVVKEARFLVAPSGCYENFPMCIAEAFACGTPVICSKLGALEELVRDGQTGLHFRPGDAADLAQKVEWASSHVKQLGEFGRAARLEYEIHYTAEMNYSLLMDIYRKALYASESCSDSIGNERRDISV